MIRAACLGLCTELPLRDRCIPMVLVCRVQQLLAAELNWSWERMPFAPELSDDGKAKRLNLVRRMSVNNNTGGVTSYSGTKTDSRLMARAGSVHIGREQNVQGQSEQP